MYRILLFALLVCALAVPALESTGGQPQQVMRVQRSQKDTKVLQRHLEVVRDANQMKRDALSGWIGPTRNFIEIVHHPHQTIDAMMKLVIPTIRKESVSVDLFMKAWKSQSTFGFCVVFGILYAVGMLIVMIVFPVARMCGKCGGKREQESASSRNCRIQGVILFTCILIMLTSVSFMFLVNEQLSVFSDGAAEPKGTVQAISTLATAYVNDVIQEVDDIIVPTLDSIPKMVDATFVEVSQDLLGKAVPEVLLYLNPTISKITDWKTAVQKAQAMGREIDATSISLEEFQRNLTQWKQENCLPDECSQVNVSTSGDWEISLTPIVGIQPSLNKLHGQITKAMDDGVNRLVQGITDVRTDVMARTEELIQQVKDHELRQMWDMQPKINRVVDDVTSEAEKVLSTISQYDPNRKVVTILVPLAIFAVVLLLLFGLVTGGCQYRYLAEPYERSKSSHVSGYVLMAAVYALLLLSPVVMILTTILFTVGSVADSYVCVPLQEPEFTLVDQMWENVRESGLINVSGTVLESLRPSAFIKGCKQNSALLHTLDLNPLLESANLSGRMDFPVGEGMDEMIGDGILPDDLGKSSAEVESFFHDIISFNTTLEASYDAAGQLQEHVQNISKLVPTLEMQASLEELLQNTTLPATLERLVKTQEDLKKALPRALGQPFLPDLVRHIIDEEPAFWKDTIRAYIENRVKQAEVSMKEEVRKVINVTVDKVKYEVGRCAPLASALEAGRIVVCELAVNPVNAFWFGLGACVMFFLPALVVATLLSKYYYRTETPWRDPRMTTSNPAEIKMGPISRKAFEIV